MPSKVQIDLIATDNASPTLDKVRQQLEMFPTFARNVDAVGPPLDRASRGFEGLDISAGKATRAIRGLAVPLISELSPALGGTASAMGHVVSSALLLGSGMGALVIGATVLAGIVGGKLITAWQDATAAKLAFDEALRTGDLTQTTTEITKLTKELGELAKGYAALESSATRAREAQLGPEGGEGAASFFAAQRGGEVASTAEKIRQQAIAREQGQRRQAELDDALAVKAREDQLEGQRLRLQGADLARSRRGLDDPALDAIERARQEKLLAADALQFQQEQPAAAARARSRAEAEYQEALRQRRLGFLKADTPSYDEALGYGALTPEFLEGQERISGRLASERLARRFEAEPPPEYDEGLGYGDVNDPKFKNEQAAISARIITGELEKQLSITQSLATLNATRTDLTLEQREGLSLQAIEEERILKLKLAQNDAQRLAVETEAQLKRQQVREATDPVAGLKRGIANIEVEFGSAGLRMQSLMQNIGGGMAGALDDTFFSVVTGKFQDLPSIAQRFGADMVRAFTGELAKLATSAIFGQLRSSFESLFPGGASGTSPFGAGSGGGPAGYDAGGGAGGGPLLTASGRPLSNAEISAAYEAGGDAGVRALRAGDAAVIGGEFVQAGAGLEQVTAGAGLRTPAASSGVTWRQGLGIAGSAALLGLTAYGATGAQSTADVVTGAVGGALAGATLGAQVGGLFGYGGTGAVGGALAGAAIAGTIALLAKQEADKQAKKAKAGEELAVAAGGGDALVRSAAGATSLPDLMRRITAHGSGYTGGTSPVAVSTTLETPTGRKPIGIENPTYEVATLQDLLAAPESLQANIQAGVDPSLLAGPNAATSASLQAIARDLVDQYQTAAQGVGLTQEDRVGGLTRRTTYPASRADMLNANLPLEIDELALAELDEDTRVMLQLEALSRVAVEQDFVSTISDGATGQIVSITRIPRSTIALPPGTPGGPPAGVPPGAIPAIDQVAALNIPRFTEPAPTGTRQLIPEMIYQQSGEGGMEVETGRMIATGPVIPPTAEELAAYDARRATFYAPYVEALTTSAKEQLAALTPANIQGAIQAGLLTPGAVAALVHAGLLPNITSILPPEVLAAIMADPGAGGDPGAPGPIGEASGIPDNPFSEATVQGLTAALTSAVPFGEALGLPSNLSGVQTAIAQTIGVLGMLGGIPGLGAIASAAMAFANSLANQADLTTEFGLANTAPHADVQGMVANALANFPDIVAGLVASGFNVAQLAANFAANPNSFSFPQSWADFFSAPRGLTGNDDPANPDAVSPIQGDPTGQESGVPGDTSGTPGSGF